MRLVDVDKLLHQGYDYIVDGIAYDSCNKSMDIEDIPTVQAIPLDRIKQAREEMNDLDYLINDAKYSDRETRVHNVDILVNEFYEIMDKLIAGVEE